MTITEALKKSRYITRPELNGFLMSVDDYENAFNRIYIDEVNGVYRSSVYSIGLDDLLSENWKALTVTIDIKDVE